jgi:hypothetical protein
VATSIIPALIDALIEQAHRPRRGHRSTTATASAGARRLPDDRRRRPDSDVAANSAESRSQLGEHRARRARRGRRDHLRALSWNGERPEGRPRRGVFAITAALEDLLRRPDLGLGPTHLDRVRHPGRALQQQDEDGASALSSSRSTSTPASEPPGEPHVRVQDRQGARTSAARTSPSAGWAAAWCSRPGGRGPRRGRLRLHPAGRTWEPYDAAAKKAHKEASRPSDAREAADLSARASAPEPVRPEDASRRRHHRRAGKED